MSHEHDSVVTHRVDRSTDIYSLGVILFQLLTGELPFRGNQRMLLHQVINDDPVTPRKLNSRIPRDLETICLKCMEKEPLRRFATARSVADELRHYLTGQPIQSRPVSHTERVWRWSKRNPAIAGLSAVVIIALLAGTTVSSVFAINASNRAI